VEDHRTQPGGRSSRGRETRLSGYARDGMVYVYIFMAALATGALVFWLTLRAAGQDARPAPADGDGFLPEPPGATPQPDGVYVPIGSDRRSWQTRVTGLLGLLILVSLAAATLAFSLYQAGSWIAELLDDYAS
jgi:hypothetical protein